MIRIFKSGRHVKRTPLSYPALWSLFQDDIELVDAPAQADLYVFAHSLDIQEAPLELVDDWRQRQRPIVLLSEEPFWDTIWARMPFARARMIDTRWGDVPVHQLTHQTSEVFHFERIPYFLLTNHRFANAYMARFRRNAALSHSDWVSHFQNAQSDLVFMFERRPEAYHSIRWPEGDLVGLCAWRTELAEAVSLRRVKRLGHSWRKGTAFRTSLFDWHLDKLVLLDGEARIMGAFENTHQPHYISEKIFDAFACAAVPAYFASPGHRIHEFGLPEASWINLFGETPQSAAAQLEQMDWSCEDFLGETANAFSQAQDALLTVFECPHNWRKERHRLRRSLVCEFERILDGGRQIPTSFDG